MRVGDGGAEHAQCGRCFGRGRYKEGLGYFLVPICDQEPRGLEVFDLPLDYGEAHICYFPEIVHSHVGGRLTNVYLPLFADNGVTGIVSSKEEERRLQLLNTTLRSPTDRHILPRSGISRKVNGKGKGDPFVVLAVPVHPSKRTGGRYQRLCFTLAIHLAEEKKLPLGPTYIGSLYARLDGCLDNITRSMGRYDGVTYDQLPLDLPWERFNSIALDS